MPSKFFLQNKRKEIYKMFPIQSEDKKKEIQDKKNEFELTDKMKKVSIKDDKKDDKKDDVILPKSPIKPLKYKL
jgi:hypothetical protein